MAHMERAADRGRWGVDGKDIGALGGAIEGVGALRLPGSDPFGFDVVEGRLLRDSGHRS